jgi:hypothetical protein
MDAADPVFKDDN